jgi:hypothetical protein
MVASAVSNDAAGAAWRTGMPIRLVVADDHPLILEGLQQLFGLEDDFELLSCCRTGTETLQAVKDSQPDVLILGACPRISIVGSLNPGLVCRLRA